MTMMMMMMIIIIIIVIIVNKDHRNMTEEQIDTAAVPPLKKTFVKITKKLSKHKNVEIEVSRMWRRMKTETELVVAVL